MQQNETRGPAAAANFVSLLFVSQNGGNVCLRKTSPFFLVWLGDTRHTAWIDLRRRGAIVATERRHFAGACFHISRGDSVHATLRKSALNFCSRYEALATPRPSHSRKRPPILATPARPRRFCIIRYVCRGKAIVEADE